MSNATRCSCSGRGARTMAWPSSGPGRPRTLAPVERLRSDIQRITYHYLHGVPDGVHPDARDIAAHVSHVVIDDAQADWAATRLGLKDRERVRAALAGAIVSASQLRHAELIVEAFEVQGIAARVGDGWELCERAEARENERLIREREEQDAKDIADAIDWLEENWSTITDKGHWIIPYCETVQREFPPPHNVRRGLQLLGGPDDAVVLGDLYEVEKLTEEQRTRADHQYDAIHEERHERLADEKRRNQEQSAR